MRTPGARSSAEYVQPLATPPGVPFVDPDSLSAKLRAHTASSHRRIEELLGLPGAIRDRQDYGNWLSRYFGFYGPLEGALALATQMDGHERIEMTRHSHRLVEDLRALEIDHFGLPRVHVTQLPHLPSFAHVVGARYVLMGATLGGRYILRDLDARLGIKLGSATRFFAADGPTAGLAWPVYRNAIDRFGIQYPHSHPDVLAGAEGTFRALQVWFAPFCDEQNRLR